MRPRGNAKLQCGGSTLGPAHAAQLRHLNAMRGLSGAASVLRSAPTTIEKLLHGFAAPETVKRIGERLDELGRAQ